MAYTYFVSARPAICLDRGKFVDRPSIPDTDKPKHNYQKNYSQKIEHKVIVLSLTILHAILLQLNENACLYILEYTDIK